MFTKSLVGLILFAGLVLAQEEALGPNGQPKPEPYSFSYSADSTGGVASHQETGDGTGRITGVYTINGPDGRERRVEYVADAQGYRAVVKTNEIGTKPEDSGDARYQVSQPSDAQLSAANNANANNPNSQQNNAGQGAVAGLANQRPSGLDQQLPESSANSPRPTTQQQQEQIPSANNQSPVAALAPGSAADEQQQTLVNLDDIQDAPPQEAPVAQIFQQELQQPALGPQRVQPQQQVISTFQQQQQPFAQGPVPTASFQPKAPAQPQLIIEAPQQQQFVEQPQRQQILAEIPQQQVQLIEQQGPAGNAGRFVATGANKGGFQQQQPQPQQQQIFLGSQGPVAQPQPQLIFSQGAQGQLPQQQQVFFQNPQQPLQLALQPVPVPTFAARQPQQPIVVAQQPQQQFSQQNEQQQNEDANEADNQQQGPGPQQQLIATGPAPGAVSTGSLAVAKGQQQQQPQQQVELVDQPIGPGSAGQRGPQPAQQFLQENQFGPRAPQQPLIVEQPQQQQPIQFQPTGFGQLPIQQQFPQQQGPVQIIEQAQPILAAPQPQLVATKGSGAVKGAAKGRGQLIAVPAPQQQIIQRFDPLPQQPQLVQQFQPAPQQQLIQQFQQVPQQQLVQQFQPAPQQQLIAAPRQPQLIQVPLEPEIQVPQVNIERINPTRAGLQPGALAVQPAAKGQQPVQQQQEQVNLLPTQGLRLEPIFKQVTVAGPGPAQQQQEEVLSQGGAKGVVPQEQQPLAKGQVEVISLKETEPATKQGEQAGGAGNDGAAEAGKTGESDSDSQDTGSAQGGDSQQGQNNESDEDGQQQQQQNAAPQTTTTTTTTTPAPLPQRPAGRLVFGKTRFGAVPGGVKIGTKSAVAAVQPVRQQVQQQVLVPVVQQQQPIKSAGANQFVSFGTRLGTKSSSS